MLKSVSIKVDFGPPAGNMQAGIGKEGKPAGAANEDGQQNVRQFTEGNKKEQSIPYDPVSHGNPVAAAKGISENIANGEVTGTVDVHPTSSS